MIPLILTMGCLFFICLGTAVASWAGTDIHIDGPDIKNIIMFGVGIAVIAFGLYCIVKASDYYHENENPKKEITTSAHPQTDTVITIVNSVPDTIFIYKFDNTKDLI